MAVEVCAKPSVKESLSVAVVVRGNPRSKESLRVADDVSLIVWLGSWTIVSALTAVSWSIVELDESVVLML